MVAQEQVAETPPKIETPAPEVEETKPESVQEKVIEPEGPSEVKEEV